MVHIYNDKLIFLLTLNYKYEDFIKNPKLYYPDWNEKYYATITLYSHPILDKDGKTIREKTKYELYKSGEYNLSFNEVELNNDIVALADGQYVKDDEVVTVPCPAEYLVKSWDRDRHIWVDMTTDLDRVRAQYDEYNSMNDSITMIELEEQGLKNEYVDMMKQLRSLIIQLETQGHKGFVAIKRDPIVIPIPSKPLKEFKDKFLIIKEG